MFRENNGILIKNLKKMVINEYFATRQDEVMELRRKIAKKCCVTDVTVYRWCTGRTVPPPLARKIIAKVLHAPERELFPNIAESHEVD